MRTKLLADLTTKENETIFDQKDGILNSLKYPKAESFQFRSEQSFFYGICDLGATKFVKIYTLLKCKLSGWINNKRPK